MGVPPKIRKEIIRSLDPGEELTVTGFNLVAFHLDVGDKVTKIKNEDRGITVMTKNRVEVTVKETEVTCMAIQVADALLPKSDFKTSHGLRVANNNKFIIIRKE